VRRKRKKKKREQKFSRIITESAHGNRNIIGARGDDGELENGGRSHRI